jgi:hypothetical protein
MNNAINNDYDESVVKVLYKTKTTAVCEKYKEIVPNPLII